jgi:hypothetical protein
MKQNYTDINIVLDRSGSMESVKDDTIGGFNAFLNSQKAVSGEATITLVQFDNEYQTVYRAISLERAQPLDNTTFVPRGSTALLDAIGRTVVETGRRLADLSEDSRPDKVIFVILTDGFENASREYDNHRINDMIQNQRDNYKWEFVFLGANQDAIATAGNMGIQAANAMTYAANSVGTALAFEAVADNIAQYRQNAAPSPAFSQIDRDNQKKAGA